MWAEQRKYEEKHERDEVRTDEEMDVGCERGGEMGWKGWVIWDFLKSGRYRPCGLKSEVCDFVLNNNELFKKNNSDVSFFQRYYYIIPCIN